jgi:YesN/AraC family two-component response regulator
MRNKVYTFSSGEEALRELPTKEPPADVVISDVEMPPGMNGIEFIKKLIELCTPE